MDFFIQSTTSADLKVTLFSFFKGAFEHFYFIVSKKNPLLLQ